MNKKISEFKEGESLTLPLLLVQVTKGVTSNGSPYLSLTLQDKSGTIEGKIWDVKEEQAAACVPGRVGEVSCEVLRYRNSLQLRVHRLTPMDQQSIELSDYVIASDIPKELLQQKIQDAISSLSNPVYKGIVSALFEEYDKPFFDYPAAAKNHHNFVGGLAVYVTGMVDLANEIVKLYPLLDRDLLVSGGLVHDLGKLTELSGPVMTEYTLEGKLIGLVLAEEEYRKNNGSDGTRLYVANIRSVEKIRKGDFIVPPKKLLQESGSAGENGFYPTKDVEDDDVPF